MKALLPLIRPEDRVLVLGIPAIDAIFSLAGREAPVFFLGDRERVYEARKNARDRRNVMFHPGDSTDIPFDDGFLTKVIGLEVQTGTGQEIARVLAGGGFAYIRSGESRFAPVAGLVLEPPIEGFTVCRKPDAPRHEQPLLTLPVLE